VASEGLEAKKLGENDEAEAGRMRSCAKGAAGRRSEREVQNGKAAGRGRRK